MSLSSPYLFLELALFVFLLGFGWEQWRLRDLWSRWFTITAVMLAIFWFGIDQIAMHLALWTFPKTVSSSFRLVSLPLEEYVLFFLHTVVCFIFLKHYSQSS
jgi:lycopene cyclase domain-containing protein